MKKYAVPQKFEGLFFRQQDDYSCGPACIVTVAKIYGVSGLDYNDIRHEMGTNDDIGTPSQAMVEASQKYLPFNAAGESIYSGGIAIARIFDEEDHYVVFLDLEKDQVLYYEPYDHVLVECDIQDIDWRSETETLWDFTINYSLFESPLIDNLKISIKNTEDTQPKKKQG